MRVYVVVSKINGRVLVSRGSTDYNIAKRNLKHSATKFFNRLNKCSEKYENYIDNLDMNYQYIIRKADNDYKDTLRLCRKVDQNFKQIGTIQIKTILL